MNFPKTSTHRVDSRSCNFINGQLSLPVSLHHVSIYYYPSILTPIAPCFLLTTFDFYATLSISSKNMIQFLKFFCFNILPYGNNNSKKTIQVNDEVWMKCFKFYYYDFLLYFFVLSFRRRDFCYWPFLPIPLP